MVGPLFPFQEFVKTLFSHREPGREVTQAWALSVKRAPSQARREGEEPQPSSVIHSFLHPLARSLIHRYLTSSQGFLIAAYFLLRRDPSPSTLSGLEQQ